MPEIISVSKIDMPYKIPQNEMKEFAYNNFSGKFSDTDRLISIFDNSKIDIRNLCVPLDYFRKKKTFSERNADFIKLTIEFTTKAVNDCLTKIDLNPDQITDFIYISSTGISTPSPDAFIINELKLNKNINRYPLWGLGCAGGAAGIAKANTIAKSNPESLVLVAASELCSLTFLSDDYSKSNFIATSLFSDGVAAVLIKGDDIKINNKNDFNIEIKDSRSRIYYDSLDVMGWDVTDDGLKVIFSKDIPTIVEKNLKPDIEEFLADNNLKTEDIKNFVTHPGGIKVIEAYVNSLGIDESHMDITKNILRLYGNMSSATVLYVLENFMKSGFKIGPGLMTSLGPGFSSEMVLLELSKD